jgi:CTP synthase
MKYLIVTGGVVSGLGKGVTISSMGRLLQSAGLKVTAIKIDPYLNVDAGTMSPFEHGEVFVLRDGGESDLDLGNYERFLSLELTSNHNLTTGKIYRKVISAERRGDYLGKTVQVVPHITDCIQDWIQEVAQIPTDASGEIADICLIEVGGTVGDIESSVFLEALRQFPFRVGADNFCLCFVSLIPCLSGEQKTKPTQHGVRDLRSLGLSPAVIFCRSTQELEQSTKQKISNFCQVAVDNVLSVHDVNNVYHVPGLLEAQGLHKILQEELKLDGPLVPDLRAWKIMASSVETAEHTCQIALIGKYTGLQDSYLSVIKSLRHAAIACGVKLDLQWIEAGMLEDAAQEGHDEAWTKLKAADGVIVPGGFGQRGWQGKLNAAQYCRENGKPYLGVCLGFQAAVVEYCRNVLNWEGADSTEFEENTPHPTVLFMPEIDKETMGGTMRLGARMTKFTHKYPDGSMSTTQLLYGGAEMVSERHRHRYEVNPEKVDAIHQGGLLLVGRDETGERMEVAELPRSQHPFYVGCQFHPEFLSRPLKPSPPFHGLIMAATGQLDAFIEAKLAELSK